MAITTDNDQLNEYNDLLRESVNYSKQLSDNVLALAGRMANMTISARATRSAMTDINRDINKTIQLSDKLNQGKLKQKEIDTQITKLQNTFNKYLDETANGVNNINEVYQKQTDLLTDISNEMARQATLQNNIAASYNTLNNLTQQLSQINAQMVGANVIQQQSLQNQANALKILIKDETDTLNIKERQLDSSKRIVKELNTELTKADRVIDAHERIVEILQQELNNAEDIKKELEKQNNAFGKLGSSAREFEEGLLDIKKILGPFTAAWEFIKKIALTASDQATKLQKGLILSSEAAYEMRDGFADAAELSGDLFATTTSLIAANAELGKQLGFNARFSNDMNVQFVKLTKEIGLSEEAAGGLAKLSKVNNITLEETKNVALETSQRLSSQYGIQLDQKDVLEEIGKLSGQTLAMFKGSVPALAEAVAKAKLLGTNLGTVKQQAESLLDFETSISNELEAELLTGRQFNLERARAASLTGDLTTAMEELTNQGIDFNNFSNMNVIAQNKVAAALGMQTDELSDQLLKQQYMGMSREQIVALGGEEVAQRLEAMNAQDKFNAAMEKMQDIVGRIVGGPLGQLADMMASLLENTTVLYTVLGAIGAISLVKLVGGLAAAAVQSGLLAAGSITAASALSFGVGVIAIGAAIGALMSMLFSAQQEATQIGDMSYANGKTLISTKEGGLFEPSPNDEIAVAPGIGDMINRPQQSSTTVVQDNSQLAGHLETLITETRNTNSSLDRLYNKTGVVKIKDIDALGTAQIIGNYNLA